MNDKLREEFEAARQGLPSYRESERESVWQGFRLRQPNKKLRAALEYSNVLLKKLPPSDEITYRINANKAVLDETKD